MTDRQILKTLENEIRVFLEKHTITELLKVVTYCVEYKEDKQREIYCEGHDCLDSVMGSSMAHRWEE